MKDIDLQIKEAFIKNNDNIEIPVEYNKMVSNTLENLNKQVQKKHSKIFNFIIGLIATIFSITGVCFATSAISEHIKQNINQGKISQDELNYDYTRELLNSGLNWEVQDDSFYYKVLTDIESYTKYKEIIKELPDEKQINFENSFIIVIYSLDYRGSDDENNLIINNITFNEQTTYISLSPSDDAPSYNNVIYAIAEKELLKEIVEIKIDKPKVDIVLPDFKPLSELNSDYDMEAAIKDGAIVVYYDYDHGILKSDNLYELDKLVNINDELKIFKIPTKDDYIRIYDAREEGALVYDIMGTNGIYYMNWIWISYEESEIYPKIMYDCFEGIIKKDGIDYESGSHFTHYRPFSEIKRGYRLPLIRIN